MLVIVILLQVLSNAATGYSGLKIPIHVTRDMGVALTDQRMELIKEPLVIEDFCGFNFYNFPIYLEFV